MKYFYLQSIFQKPHKISPIELIKQPLNTSKLLDQHWPIMHRLYTNIYYLYVCMYICTYPFVSLWPRLASLRLVWPCGLHSCQRFTAGTVRLLQLLDLYGWQWLSSLRVTGHNSETNIHTSVLHYPYHLKYLHVK